MRKNFAAWKIDPAAFFALRERHQQLAFLVRFAVLAPSSHNSQPWRFRLEDSHLDVLPDLGRALPATDASNNQLYVSLGCALENLMVAADAFGLRAGVEYHEDPSAPADGRAFARVRIAFPDAPVTSIPRAHRVFAIGRRATNRSGHDGRPLPPEMLAAIRAESRTAVETFLVSQQGARDAVADLVLEGGAIAMADPGFRRELAAYMLPNGSARPVGMTGATVGMGMVASWLVPKLLPRMNPRGKARPQEVKLLKQQTAAFVIVASHRDEPSDWMEAGRTYMRLALDAERLGLTTNNLAAPVTPPEVRRRLAALVRTTAAPQMCFRVGYADKAMPHCPRLSAEDVIERRV